MATEAAEAAGEEPELRPSSSFEEWKAYFLQRNLANPLTASTSWEIPEKPVSKQEGSKTRTSSNSSTLETASNKLCPTPPSKTLEISRTSIRTGSNMNDAESISGSQDKRIFPATSGSSKDLHVSADPCIEPNETPQMIDKTVSGETPAGPVATAVKLMCTRGESDSASSLRAFDIFEGQRLANIEGIATASTESIPLSTVTKLAAEAKLAWIRSMTEGNQLKLASNGRVTTGDSPDFCRTWKNNAPEVLQLIKGVGEDPAQDPELQQMLAETIMYSLSSKGILQAFTSGETTAYTSAVKVLMDKYSKQDNGVAYVFQGAYYLAAPWPIRSPKKASGFFEKALAINGRSRRNLFYTGLGRLECGDRKGAAEAFRRAVSDELSELASATERDIGVPLRREAQKGLEIATGPQ